MIHIVLLNKISRLLFGLEQKASCCLQNGDLVTLQANCGELQFAANILCVAQ